MLNLIVALSLSGVGGYAYAQDNSEALNIVCSEFSGMESDQQNEALTAALEADEAAPGEIEAEEIMEAVTSVCDADPELTMREALEQATAQ